jgi:hypothetical protein
MKRALADGQSKRLDKRFVCAEVSAHDQERAHHLHVFLAVPVKGGWTDHIVNKPPSGGFVVSTAS